MVIQENRELQPCFDAPRASEISVCHMNVFRANAVEKLIPIRSRLRALETTAVVLFSPTHLFPAFSSLLLLTDCFWQRTMLPALLTLSCVI